MGNPNQRIMKNGMSKHFMYFWKGWNIQKTMLNLEMQEKKNGSIVTYRQSKVFCLHGCFKISYIIWDYEK